MDILTLAMAKSYTDSKQLVSVETSIRRLYGITIAAGKNYNRPSDLVNDPFIEGQKYIVTVNGEKYEGICKVAGMYAYVGNLSMQNASKENTGESYCITNLIVDSDPTVMGYALDPTTGDTSVERVITVEAVENVIVPIDPKYLPGWCLPIVELTAQVDVEFTAEEIAVMDELTTKAMPFILKTTYNDTSIVSVANYTKGVGGNDFWIAHLGDGFFIVQKIAGVWSVRIEY